MDIVKMEKLSDGTIRVGLGANKDAKPELFVDLYRYTCNMANREDDNIKGSLIEIYDNKNKNRMRFHYYDDYNTWEGGLLAFVEGHGKEREIVYDDPEYRLLSFALTPVDSKKLTVEILRDPESVFNNYPGKKTQQRPVKSEKNLNAIHETIKKLSQKTR